MIRLSIVIPVLDSHRIVRRQIKHFKKMNLPREVEIILIDDGSDPPLKEKFSYTGVRNLYIYPTNDKRPWTNPCAKNFGVRLAQGEYIFITDIDHILPKEAILSALEFDGDKMEFTREYGILNNRGNISQDFEQFRKYGFFKNKLSVYKHTNTFVMRKSIFWEIGGYPEADCEVGRQDHRDDTHLHNRYKKHYKQGKCKKAVVGPVTYVFPTRDPKLFHNLDRTLVRALSTEESLEKLIYRLDKYKKVHYLRYGDTEIYLMKTGKGNRGDIYHSPSPAFGKELLESFSVKNDSYMKAIIAGFPKEPGMGAKVFWNDSNQIRKFKRWIGKWTKETVFYNPILFHYLAAFNPEPLREFTNKYIKPKTKMFIGGNIRECMESYYGKIDYFVKAPGKQAYYAIDEWWPEVKKNIDKVEMVLPSVGAASPIVSKRLWDMGVDVHCIDIGSINDVLEGRITRGWIKRVGLNKIRGNLLVSE